MGTMDIPLTENGRNVARQSTGNLQGLKCRPDGGRTRAAQPDLFVFVTDADPFPLAQCYVAPCKWLDSQRQQTEEISASVLSIREPYAFQSELPLDQSLIAQANPALPSAVASTIPRTRFY